MNARLSVIIPALNEALYLPACLAAIRSELPEAEVLVVDGGSVDDTVSLARRHGATVLSTSPSRGAQCRLGAEQASGDALLFLHADTRLGSGARQRIATFLDDLTNEAATLRVRYVERGFIYRLLEWGCRFDSVWSSLGDQGMLVRRALYDAIGGIPALPLFEDVRFLQSLRRRTRIRSVPLTLTVSARRFRVRGVYRQIAFNSYLTLLFLFGASPEALARRYRSRCTDPDAAVGAVGFPSS